jgi:hypothetical protein
MFTTNTILSHLVIYMFRTATNAYDFSPLDVLSSFLLMGALHIAVVYECIIMYDTKVTALRALSLTQLLFGHGKNSHAKPQQ